MTAESGASPGRKSEIIVESDWLTTVGTVVLFLLFCWQLVREIDRFVWGHFVQSPSVRGGFFGIFTSVYAVLGGILCFLFISWFSNKPVKAACLLMGLNLVAGGMLGFFQISPRTFHVVAMTRSGMRQVALAIVLVAIPQWLKSVIRRDAPAEPQGGNA